MYKGKMTKELDELYDKYYEKFDCYPDEYDDLEYYEETYDSFVRDIKISLKENKEIEDLYL